jgi:hypothetical protein
MVQRTIRRSVSVRPPACQTCAASRAPMRPIGYRPHAPIGGRGSTGARFGAESGSSCKLPVTAEASTERATNPVTRSADRAIVPDRRTPPEA